MYCALRQNSNPLSQNTGYLAVHASLRTAKISVATSFSERLSPQAFHRTGTTFPRNLRSHIFRVMYSIHTTLQDHPVECTHVRQESGKL